MKINLEKIKSYYNNQISQAKANDYEAVMIPLECEYDLYCLNNIDESEYIYDIATDYGWDRFLLIDFLNKTEKLIDLYEMEAA